MILGLVIDQKNSVFKLILHSSIAQSFKNLKSILIFTLINNQNDIQTPKWKSKLTKLTYGRDSLSCDS